MNAIALEVLDPVDLLQFVEADLHESDAASAGPLVPRDAVGLRRPPVLRRAAYLAALGGEPWRPYV